MSSRKRLYVILTLLVVGGALGALILTSFTGSLVYFYTPSELAVGQGERVGEKVRIGGMVQEGSLVREEGTLRIRFLVTDGENEIPVRYEGVTPDLFREGQGVIVEGVYQPGREFVAETILAKHSEDYIPVEMSREGISKAKESLLRSLQ